MAITRDYAPFQVPIVSTTPLVLPWFYQFLDSY